MPLDKLKFTWGWSYPVWSSDNKLLVDWDPVFVINGTNKSVANEKSAVLNSLQRAFNLMIE